MLRAMGIHINRSNGQDPLTTPDKAAGKAKQYNRQAKVLFEESLGCTQAMLSWWRNQGGVKLYSCQRAIPEVGVDVQCRYLGS